MASLVTLGVGVALLGGALISEAASDQPGMSRTTAFFAGSGLGVSSVGGVMLYFDLSPHAVNASVAAEVSSSVTAEINNTVKADIANEVKTNISKDIGGVLGH